MMFMQSAFPEAAGVPNTLRSNHACLTLMPPKKKKLYIDTIYIDTKISNNHGAFSSPLPVGLAACFFGLSGTAMTLMSASGGLDLPGPHLCHFMGALDPRHKGFLQH